MDKLKPCPFCGSPRQGVSNIKYTNKRFVICECGAKGATKSGKTAEAAYKQAKAA